MAVKSSDKVKILLRNSGGVAPTTCVTMSSSVIQDWAGSTHRKV